MIRIDHSYAGRVLVKEFRAQQIIIGRVKEGIAVDLDLNPDLAVSRLHARVWCEHGEYWIEDFNSTLGTQLNGKEIKGKKRRRLRSGDTIKIGETILRATLIEKQGDCNEEDFAAKEMRPLEEITKSLDAGLNPYESTERITSDTKRQLALFYELPLEFGAQTRLDELLQVIVERVVDVIHGAKRGALLVKDRATGKLALWAHVPPGGPAVSFTFVERAMKHDYGFIWPPAPRVSDNSVVSVKTPESAEEYGIRSAMYTPLMWKSKALGALCVDNNDVGDAFSTNDLQLLQAVANHAAMAVANLQQQEDLLRQAEFLNGILTTFSPQIVELWKSRRGRPRLGGDFREATIMLSDIRGFTNLSATMSPDDVTDMLNDYFGKLVPIIFRWGGTIDKFVGDAILAVFGSPQADEDQHLHALRAAMEMQLAMSEVNAQRAEQNKRTGELGIGIHCGEVVHGFIGTAERMEFTVIGDAVNRASRYCDGARGGEVLISPQIYQWVYNHISSVQTSIPTKHEGALVAYRVKQIKTVNK